MILPDRIIEKIIEFDKTKLESFRIRAKESEKSLQEIILDEKIIDETELTKKYAEYIDVPFVVLSRKEIDPKILSKIPEPVARQYRAVVFDIDAKTGQVHLAIEDPDDLQAISFLQKRLGFDLKVHIATSSNIQQILDLYRGDVEEELTHVINIQSENPEDSQVLLEDDLSEDSPIAQTVNLILEYAINSNASDVHIEPREEFVQVRYRIDGILQEVNRLPRNVLNSLVSRIKILSNLKIDERRVPQDGRFKIVIHNTQFALRVSTLPVADGEKVVMRILGEGSKALTLKQLGLWGKSLEIIEKSIREPNGMLLVTGPTGSGKSTTLFSVLSILNTPDVNISTIEDPVEYKIPGVNQTQTNPKAGMTFASGLRALLRQDPNVIMVGEIRDSETANLGVQAALTGHLVFSTLHTNNAATCLPRLLDMNIEPFLIASTVNSVIGQRLVRRLCKNCRERVELDVEMKKELLSMIDTKSESIVAKLHELEKQAIVGGIGEGLPLSSTAQDLKYVWKPHDGGCDECNHIGYRGRIGIYEVLDNSIPVQKLIISNATAQQIQDQAITEDMITMKTDGIIKAMRGETTFDEVFGATKE